MVRVIQKRRHPLPAWIEANIRLPASVTAEPGPIKLYPYLRGIAAAVGDTKVERVTVLNSARISYTTHKWRGLAGYRGRCHSPGAKRTTAPSNGGCVFWNEPPA